jgi:hypothetical protein
MSRSRFMVFFISTSDSIAGESPLSSSEYISISVHLQPDELDALAPCGGGQRSPLSRARAAKRLVRRALTDHLWNPKSCTKRRRAPRQRLRRRLAAAWSGCGRKYAAQGTRSVSLLMAHARRSARLDVDVRLAALRGCCRFARRI